jgi:hypothetical protein
MKLKAPPGVGDPCVAGVIVAARDGFYDVEVEIGALLIECFGFVEFEGHAEQQRSPVRVASRRKSPAKRA